MRDVRVPTDCQSASTIRTASSGESSYGQTKTSAFRYSVGKADSGPDFSVPAIGWPPMKWTP